MPIVECKACRSPILITQIFDGQEISCPDCKSTVLVQESLLDPIKEAKEAVGRQKAFEEVSKDDLMLESILDRPYRFGKSECLSDRTTALYDESFDGYFGGVILDQSSTGSPYLVLQASLMLKKVGFKEHEERTPEYVRNNKFRQRPKEVQEEEEEGAYKPCEVCGEPVRSRSTYCWKCYSKIRYEGRIVDRKAYQKAYQKSYRLLKKFVQV